MHSESNRYRSQPFSDNRNMTNGPLRMMTHLTFVRFVGYDAQTAASSGLIKEPQHHQNITSLYPLAVLIRTNLIPLKMENK